MRVGGVLRGGIVGRVAKGIREYYHMGQNGRKGR